jgi:hypothetical protein
VQHWSEWGSADCRALAAPRHHPQPRRTSPQAEQGIREGHNAISSPHNHRQERFPIMQVELADKVTMREIVNSQARMQVEIARVEHWGSVQQWLERDSSDCSAPAAPGIVRSVPVHRRPTARKEAPPAGSPKRRFPQPLRDDPPAPVAFQRFPQWLRREAAACAVPKSPFGQGGLGSWP